MSPRAPARRYTSSELAASAAALRSFMEEHTERLDFEHYDGLRETEAQLEALAEYLAADDPPDLYLARLLAIAENELRWYSEWLDLPDRADAIPSLFDT